MGLETRIGIATGLVIVVVASVYFYQGRRGGEEDLIFATTPGAAPDAAPSVSLRIPRGAEPSISELERSVQATPRVSAAPALVKSYQPTKLEKSGRPRNAPPELALAGGARSRPPAPAVTPLRTAPSLELTKATEANTEDPPLDPIRLGDAFSADAGPNAKDDAQAKPALTEKPSGLNAANPPKAAGYTVQSGDTLYSIANRTYHQSGRWREILRANAELLRNDPKRLKPGMVLKLP